MNRMDFTQSVVRIRVLEKKLLRKEQFEQMVEAEDLEEMRKMLQATPYAKHLTNITNFHQYEDILEAELKDVYTTIREISPMEEIVNMLALKYDYHNLKVLCKEMILKTNLSHLYLSVGSFPIENLKTEQQTKPAIEKVLADYKKTEDPQRMEIILDHLYMNHLYQMVEKSELPLITEYVKAMIDFINVRTVIRLQKQKKDISFLKEVFLENGNIEKDVILYSLHDSVTNMIHTFRNEKISASLIRSLEAYQQTNQLTEFEKEMDDYLTSIIKETKAIHFGPEPLIAYILAKEMEIKNLRIIMISKQNNISLDRVKKRVRDVYV